MSNVENTQVNPVVEKKVRKERADKGKKRGPRKAQVQ